MKINERKMYVIALCLIIIAVVIMIVSIFLFNKKPQVDNNNTVNNTVVNTDTNKVETKKEPVTEYTIDGINVLSQIDLVAGCEVYACTVVLQYMDYDIDEFVFADTYLVSSSVHHDGYNLYGPDLNSAYAGDVYTNYGYGANAPIMAKCMNSYLSTTGTGQKAVVLKNETLESLCEKYIVNDMPVVVWGTLGMTEPYVGYEWVIDYVDENADGQIGDTEQWYQNEHCLTLVGFDEDYYYFADSMTGEISGYDKEDSQHSFDVLGNQAIIVK